MIPRNLNKIIKKNSSMLIRDLKAKMNSITYFMGNAFLPVYTTV